MVVSREGGGFETKTQRKATEDCSCLACLLPLPSSRAVPMSQECSQGRQGLCEAGGVWGRESGGVREGWR